MAMPHIGTHCWSHKLSCLGSPLPAAKSQIVPTATEPHLTEGPRLTTKWTRIDEFDDSPVALGSSVGSFRLGRYASGECRAAFKQRCFRPFGSQLNTEIPCPGR